jgi:hypothetical protein
MHFGRTRPIADSQTSLTRTLNVHVQRSRAAAFAFSLLMTVCGHWSLCGSNVRGDDDSNQPQKTGKLHEKKREPHGCHGVCMD